MKNNLSSQSLYWVLAVWLCLGFTSAVEDSPKSEDCSVTSVSVHFGRGPSCIGRGVCSVDEVEGIGNPAGGSVQGLLSLDSEDHLQLEIAKSAISVQQKEEQFSGAIFKVIDPYELPSALASQISGSTSLTITPGDYAVGEYSDHYLIRF